MNWEYRPGYVIIPDPQGGNNIIATKDFTKMSYAPHEGGGMVVAPKGLPYYVAITDQEFLTIQEEIKNL